MLKKKKLEKVVVFTDGGARGNPGPAAIGIVIYDGTGNMLKSYGQAIGRATNNEAEYRAVIFALEKIKALYGKEKIKRLTCEVNMDSELVARQLGGTYRIEEERLWPLFMKIWNLKIDFERIAFNHVPREKNREADRMVNEALDKEQQRLFS